MGIFKIFKGNKEKKIIEKREVLPIVVKTNNVNESIQKISDLHNIKISNIDFDLLSCQTYIKFGEDAEFIEVDIEGKEHFCEEDNFIDENVVIKQSYEIKIRRYDFVDDFEILGKVAVSKDLTLAKYFLSPSSLLVYRHGLDEIIVDELNKKKLKNGLLINILDDEMLDSIDNIVSKIRVLGSLDKEEEIILCRGKSAIKSINGTIVEHYKKKSKKYDEFGEKINFKKENLVYPIKKNQLIIEFLKPVMGVNGRNCRGKVIVVKEPREIEFPNYILGDGIERRDIGNRVEYHTTKNGYLSFEDNKISVKDELEIRQINLRTGSVIGADESDVKLEVTENNHLKEAIADGMKVETTDLLVKGNIGDGAKIKAKKVIIEGQTHRKSKIIADNANINIHRGYLKGIDVTIHRLESGIVEAEKVHIMQATGGTVKANEIKIDVLGSHLTLMASHSIEIETVKGSENSLIISPSVFGDSEIEVEKLEDKIEESKILARQLKEKFDKNREIILRNKNSVAKIKKKLLEDRANGVRSSQQLKLKLKKFNELFAKTKDMDRKIKSLKEDIQLYKQKIDDMQIGIFGAKIVSKSEWKPYNRLEFKMLEPPMNIVYDTKENDMAGTYKLIEKEGMVYEIKKV